MVSPVVGGMDLWKRYVYDVNERTMMMGDRVLMWDVYVSCCHESGADHPCVTSEAAE